MVNELCLACLACQKCGRVIECDDYEYFEEENWRRSSTALPTNNDYLKSVLRKWNIKEMFSSSEVDFLGNVIAQFQKMSCKSVNYSCFMLAQQKRNYEIYFSAPSKKLSKLVARKTGVC